VSFWKAEKKWENILKDQSRGEAKHSTLRCRKIANSDRNVGGVRQCCFERYPMCCAIVVVRSGRNCFLLCLKEVNLEMRAATRECSRVAIWLRDVGE
jgi:hypothetical protein